MFKQMIRKTLMNLLNAFTQTLWQRVSSLATTKIIVSKMLVLFLIVLDVPLFCNSIGYSYSRFVGPVTGPEEKIIVRDANSGIGNVDYVAHPKYQFAYGIEDNEQRILQNRQETRDGDNVHGVYSVVDPDGSLRVVKYTADNVNGFQAEVITNGIPVIYGHHNLNEQTKGNGYWEAELPSVSAGSADTESGEDYAFASEGDEEEYENEPDEDEGYEEEEDAENEYEYDGNPEVGSSEEDFEDAEGVDGQTVSVENF